MTTNKNKDKYAKIKEEFEKIYYGNLAIASHSTQFITMWQFIVKVLDQREKEIVDEQKKELRKKIEKMKIPPPSDDYTDGVNNAILDILELL